MEAEPDADATPTSKILLDLDAAESRPIYLGTMFGAMGSRVHGMVLLLLALPDTLPMPIPSTSTVLGIPLLIVAAHLVLFGEGSQLPGRAERITVSPRVVRALVRYAVPVLQFVERLSRPRLTFLLRSNRALGLICLYLSMILLLPIPFMNALPALCLVAIALGMIQRDGLIVAAGIAGTVALTFLILFFADRLASVVGRMTSSL
jgi:hypothetical protein